MSELQAALAERNEILSALDEQRAKDFVTKHGGTLPAGEIDWLLVLHFARHEVTAFNGTEAGTDSHIYLAREVGETLATSTRKEASVALDLVFPKTMTDAFIASMPMGGR